jgi:hypothetical protein
MSVILIQKADLSAEAFSNDNTNAAGGIGVRVDTGSTVGDAIASAVLAGATPDATETIKGKVELATTVEATTGTDTTRAVTPAGVAAAIAAIPDVPDATDTVKGKVELATSAEVITGTDTTRAVTVAGLVSRIATDTRTGLVELATTAETTTGTSTTLAVTPAGVAAAIAAIPVVPDATDTVKGKVSLAVAANHPSVSDTEAATPAYVNARIAAMPADKYVSGIQSYDAATNTITFALADGTTSTANASALVADAVAEALASVDVQLIANDGTTVLGFIKPAA